MATTAVLLAPGVASADANDSGPAACTWTPGVPTEWVSANTGYIRARLTVSSGCSSDDDWNGQLEVQRSLIWDTVDELNWRGTADQSLLWDCRDGGVYIARSRMEDKETGQVKHSDEAIVECLYP